MEQPPAPGPYSNNSHVWPNQFIVDWKFYFVPDDSDVPPYTPLPTTPYNVTTGRTYYYNNPTTGDRNMKEVKECRICSFIYACSYNKLNYTK
jgi:hypothetical protein